MLQAKRLSVFYGDLPALWEVSFEVRAGELVALIGPNGAGKTTTLKAILGLLRPRSGEIRFLGKALEREPSYQRVRDGIALVPEGRRIFPALTVEENLELGAYAATDQGEKMRDRLERVYTLFPRLGERRRQLAGTFSGGEQQMLAIARALMAEPKLLLMDEPSLGLAPIIVEQIFITLEKLQKGGLTILLAEQNAVLALELASRSYLVQEGHIVLHGESKELVQDGRVKQVYLGGVRV